MAVRMHHACGVKLGVAVRGAAHHTARCPRAAAKRVVACAAGVGSGSGGSGGVGLGGSGGSVGSGGSGGEPDKGDSVGQFRRGCS